MGAQEFYFETDPVNMNAIGLFKTAELYNLTLPPQNIHFYLAGVIEKTNNPLKKETFFPYIKKSLNELEGVILECQERGFLNAFPFLFAQSSGDFALEGILKWSEEDCLFPMQCYSIAQLHTGKLNNPLYQVMGELAMNLRGYLPLLKKYYQHLGDDKFKITQKDLISFKEHLEKEISKPLIILPEQKETQILFPKQIKLPKKTKKKTKRLLI